MRHVKRQPSKFGAIDFADQLGRELNLPLDRIADTFSFSKAMQDATKNKNLMRGRRVERMFEYVLASLGKSNLVTAEDSSAALFAGAEVQAPDYFVSLQSGSKYLVEVKHQYLQTFDTAVTLSRAYLQRLKRYCELKGNPLALAVFWSNLDIWTINKIEDIETQNGTVVLRFSAAHQRSIGGEFGDRMVAAVPPLICRICADSGREASIDQDNVAHFTINALQFFSEGKEILDSREKAVAFYLMFHSKWRDEDALAVMDGKRVNYIEFAARGDDEMVPGQEFQSLGTLAGMISSYYEWLTTADEEIVRLTPQLGPAELSPGIDDQYVGEVLRLWRFRLEPNYASLVRSSK